MMMIMMMEIIIMMIMETMKAMLIINFLVAVASIRMVT
jgi:hypothetical protein